MPNALPVTTFPHQEELDYGITAEEARINEDNFFRDNAPWNGHLSLLSDRFGIRNLSAQLSKELINLAHQSVPEMKLRVEEALSETKIALGQLPKELG